MKKITITISDANEISLETLNIPLIRLGATDVVSILQSTIWQIQKQALNDLDGTDSEGE